MTLSFVVPVVLVVASVAAAASKVLQFLLGGARVGDRGVELDAVSPLAVGAVGE